MSKRTARPNPQAVTEKGTYLLCVDSQRIYTSYRHTDEALMKAEATRLAKATKERILVLKVVGVIDKRVKDDVTPHVADSALTQGKEKV